MRFLTPILLSLFAAGPCIAQEGPRDVMVVFDMSGSMWGQVDGVAKVEIARDAFDGLLSDWDAENTRTGLIAYGHRRRGDCTDIEVLAQPSDGADIASLVAGLQPRGKTPLSDAVRLAAEALKFTEEAATVVLLSDGVETCEADPCAVGAELEALGLDFTAHVIGFDIAEADRAQLQCLANNTGGQYFDAADASGLAEAMKGVVVATATAAPEDVQTTGTQAVTIRVRMENDLISLPDEVIVYQGDLELGRLSDVEAVVPGLAVDLPFGVVKLRVEGQDVSGEFTLDITNETEILDLNLSAAADDYVVWRQGQFPVLGDHIVLLNNTTGVDRTTFYRAYVYPAGSTDESLRIKTSNIAPSAGVYHAVTISSPEIPGDYEIVPIANDGTEYARIPISFAAEIAPTWLGAREVAAGGTLDAYWAGSSNTRDQFRFVLDGQDVSRTRVIGMAQEDGFKLLAPEEPGLYELIFISEYVNNFEFKETSLGQIAVGVPLPDDDSNAPVTLDSETSDPDTDGLAEETEAMGGEEGPLSPVGDLHGDWVLAYVDATRMITLAKTQLIHDASETMAGGGFSVQAPTNWGFGTTGTFGEMVLSQESEDELLITLTVDAGTLVTALTPRDIGWGGIIPNGNGTTTEVLLMNDEDMRAVIARLNPDPIMHQLMPVDERGERLTTLVNWTIQSDEMDSPDTFSSDTDRATDPARKAGTYHVTATSGELTGSTNIAIRNGERRANFVVLKPTTEGADLPISVDFYCSEGEDCAMEMADVPISFTLPLNWGAERPSLRVDHTTEFTMATNTPNGSVIAALTQNQHRTDLGPCVTLLSGTFCHSATDDPRVLTDLEMLKRTLSFKGAGRRLVGEAAENLLEKLTGAAE